MAGPPGQCDNACVPKILGDSLADHRDQVRQRLFAAIADLIVQRGYDAITLADIAAEAGVGRTAVYNHFPDKESVLLAWAHDETEQYLVRLKAALADPADPVDRLDTFLRMQMRELARHHTRLAAIGSALTTPGRLAMREHVEPMMAILRGILADAITAGSIPQQEIETAVPMISAVASARFTVGLQGDALESVIDSVIGFVRHGIGAR